MPAPASTTCALLTDTARDGLFKIGGRRRAVYARRGVSLAEQIRAARGVRYV